MRYCSDNKTDPGFVAFVKLQEEGKHVKVFLDGVEQFKVCMIDTDAGIIERCVLNGEGRVQTNPEKPDEIWTETVTGVVTIEIV